MQHLSDLKSAFSRTFSRILTLFLSQFDWKFGCLDPKTRETCKFTASSHRCVSGYAYEYWRVSVYTYLMYILWWYWCLYILKVATLDEFVSSTYLIEFVISRWHIGWLRSVGSLKLWVSFAKHILFYRALLQKRPVISRSLLIDFRDELVSSR